MKKDGKTAFEPRRSGRPPGKQHDACLRIRIPRKALEAIKILAKRGHVSVSQVVRSGVLASLAHAIGPEVEIARDRTKSPRRRLSAMEALRAYLKAGLHMGPVGLQLARQKALGGLAVPTEP